MSANSEWQASLATQIEDVRAALAEREPAEIARSSGARLDDHEDLTIEFLGQTYVVTWPDLVVRDADGAECSPPVQSSLLQHLDCADGAPIEGRWVSLRELPNGAFYERAFQGYTGQRLARTFRGDVDGFREAARSVGGEPLDVGDASFQFWVLPRVPLAVVYWAGDDEFPASAHVLFDASAAHYHHLEMLAHLGSTLCSRIISAYGGTNGHP